MMELWKSLSGNARFSIIAFFSTGVLGLLSMGFLGIVLYYPVSFLLRKYPSATEWHGDWVWAAMIGVGMFWSVGFLFGGIAWHFLAKLTSSKMILYVSYAFILWVWAAVLWYFTVKSNIKL